MFLYFKRHHDTLRVKLCKFNQNCTVAGIFICIFSEDNFLFKCTAYLFSGRLLKIKLNMHLIFSENIQLI